MPPATAISRNLANYAHLVKLSHSVFAMPFALLAAVLAASTRQAGFVRQRWFWLELGLVVLAMVTARSAAMAFNRIADRRFDAVNPRTASRPLVSGQLSLPQAWAFFAACAAIFLAATAGFLAFGNAWPILLALPVLAYLCVYSLSKRFTPLCHLLLGVGLGISPLAAWVAIAPQAFGPLPLVLGAAVVCWVAGFDIIYALQDIQIDLQQGLHSLPAALGPANALWISRALHLTSVTCLVWVFALSGGALGVFYLAGVAIAAATLLVEQLLVSPANFTRVNAAFFTCNGVVSIVLGGCGIVDVLLRT